MILDVLTLFLWLHIEYLALAVNLYAIINHLYHLKAVLLLDSTCLAR